MLTFRAPGKLFWIGEYAVLDGGPALVAAVDRYALTEFLPAESGVLFCLNEAPYPLWTPDGTLLPDGVPEGAELVAAVARAVHAHSGPPAPCRLHCDSSAMSADTKLGLGSSGAVAAGLVAALLPDLPAPEALAMAIQAHRDFQNGQGSGADVIASCLGGLTRVQPGTEPTPITIPNDLQFAVLYTGTSASTRVLVQAFRAWQQRDGASATARVDAMARTAHQAIDDLNAGRIAAWLDAVRAYAEHERALTAAGVGVMTDPVERCVAAAESAGWAAKPSGAGGGDVVIAFAGPDGDPQRLDAAADAAGVERVALALAPRGVLHPSR